MSLTCGRACGGRYSGECEHTVCVGEASGSVISDGALRCSEWGVGREWRGSEDRTYPRTKETQTVFIIILQLLPSIINVYSNKD